MSREQQSNSRHRHAPIEMSGSEFREAGHALVDEIAEFLDSIRERPVTPGATPETIRELLGNKRLPESGLDAKQIALEAARLVIDNSLLNGNPRFMGYITSSAAPIGALGDLLAAAVNPNVGGWVLSPMASEIERQTIRWIAELIGYPSSCSGLLVSGGNMANFVGFLAGRCAKSPRTLREQGLREQRQMTVYVSRETHTWIQKAADLFGLGTKAIRWIPVDQHRRMEMQALSEQVAADRSAGFEPIMVVGAAGTVAVGAVDPLSQIAEFCQKENLWFHVDGAYGAPAAALPETDPDLQSISLADSLALDPHKWLYSPLEAGCVLVQDGQRLVDAFSFTPEYYHFHEGFSEQPVNFFEWGMQNSRGFRSLKVWMALRQVGRNGYVQMIREDIELARQLYHLVAARPELEAVTNNLSITTFRYVPADLPSNSEGNNEYLDELNRAILNEIEAGGEVFVSNAVVNDQFLLRACIVNFRTTVADLEKLVEVVVRVGRAADAKIRPEKLAHTRRA